MSLIVVEGVDASGKSTLLEQIRLSVKKRYFVTVRHSCRPLKDWHVRNFLDMVEDYSECLEIIADRHPLISEPIYGPLLRGENLIDGIETLDSAAIRLKDTVERVIYCRPSRSTIKSNLYNLPQLEGVIPHIDSLIDAYDDRMDQLRRIGVRIIPYDYQEWERPNFEHLFFGDAP